MQKKRFREKKIYFQLWYAYWNYPAFNIWSYRVIQFTMYIVLYTL